MVKAGGYGHGAVRVARAALDGGATGLAVATLEEARELEGLTRAEHVLVTGQVEDAADVEQHRFGRSVGSRGHDRRIYRPGALVLRWLRNRR